MATDRIRVTGKPKREINVDLLAQAILLIAEQRLRAEQIRQGEPGAETDVRRASA